MTSNDIMTTGKCDERPVREIAIMMDVFHTRPHFHKSANSEMVRPIFLTTAGLKFQWVFHSKDMIAKFFRFC